MDMPPMNSSMMSMSDAIMVFYSSTTTPLYISSWNPKDSGHYAATCVFLIALTATFRGLFAFKVFLEQRWLDEGVQRRYVVIGERLKDETMRDNNRETLVLSANGIEEEVVVVTRRQCETRPWRISRDGPRAVLDTIIVGVGYLL